MEEPPLFRVPKRRKIARLHPDNDEAEPSQETESNAFDQTINESDDENTFSIVRARKPARKARGGINFTTTSQIDPGQTDSMALVPADGSSDRPQDMSNRFTSSTGQVVDVDRHMMAYIDSEMARKRPSTATTPLTHEPITSQAQSAQTNALPTPLPNPSQPQQHQLSEVDLTTLPTKPPPPIPRQLPPRKPRLGRDGKPLRPRPRHKRRNSNDVARDALVEQVLHEHKVEHVYQAPRTTSHNTTTESKNTQDTNTDEIFAERFRQQFLDQVAERKQAQMQKKSTGGAATGGTVEKGNQGPKLGGSRSARARMAAAQQEKQQQQGGEKEK